MPTITRQLVDTPSRETLFDALRLHAEGRVITFDVALPESIPIDDGTEKTQEELLELGLYAMPFFTARFRGDNVCGIEPRDAKGELWLVKMVLDENRYASGHTFRLEANLNTRNRRESGNLVVSWTTGSEARSV